MNQATAVLFPGQGSQCVGMGRTLYEGQDQAREIFREAEQILGFPLSRLCFEGPAEELNDTVNAQPAIFTVSYACWQALQAGPRPVKPRFLAGHSLGEYTALAAAGCFSFEEGLRLVRRRGLAMKAAGAKTPGGMAALLKLEATLAAAICRQAEEETGGTVCLANDNCPGQVVIAGDATALARAVELARAERGRVVPLAVSVASHSPLMEPAVQAMRAALDALPLREPQVPVVGNVTARPLETAGAVREELLAQLTSPVQWTRTVLWMRSQGVQRYLEVGPGNVLTGLVRRIVPDAELHNVGGQEDLSAWSGQ